MEHKFLQTTINSRKGNQQNKSNVTSGASLLTNTAENFHVLSVIVTVQTFTRFSIRHVLKFENIEVLYEKMYKNDQIIDSLNGEICLIFHIYHVIISENREISTESSSKTDRYHLIIGMNDTEGLLWILAAIWCDGTSWWMPPSSSASR